MFSFYKPKFVIKNNSSLKLNLMGICPIKPGATIDLYKQNLGNSLTSIILRELDFNGSLRNEIQAGRITLVSFSNEFSATATDAGRIRSRLVYFDDFLIDNPLGNSNWTQVGVSGGVIQAQATTSNSFFGAAGVMLVGHTTTSGSAALYRQSIGAIPLGFGAAQIEVRSRLPAITDTENTIFRLGLGNATTATGLPTNGLSFVCDLTQSQTVWMMESIFGGVTVSLPTSAPITPLVWQNLRIEINADGTSADFMLNNNIVGTLDLSSVAKAENSVRYGPYVQAIRVNGVANRALGLDYVALEKDMSRA